MWREAVMQLLDQLEAENPEDPALAPKAGGPAAASCCRCHRMHACRLAAAHACTPSLMKTPPNKAGSYLEGALGEVEGAGRAQPPAARDLEEADEEAVL